MTPALHAPHRRRRALLGAIALVTTTAATLPTAGVAAAPSPTRLTIGSLPASPALGLLPQIDALGSHVIAVAPAAGLTDEACTRGRRIGWRLARADPQHGRS